MKKTGVPGLGLSYQWSILREVNHRDSSLRRRADPVEGSNRPTHPTRSGLDGVCVDHGKVVAGEGSQKETPKLRDFSDHDPTGYAQSNTTGRHPTTHGSRADKVWTMSGVDNLPSATRRWLEGCGDGGLEFAPEIRVFPDGTKTAIDAARAVGCLPSQIVKSLVFEVDGEAVLALVPGDRRLRTESLARAAGGTTARRASLARVKEATGYAAGGTPPFGHTPSNPGCSPTRRSGGMTRCGLRPAPLPQSSPSVWPTWDTSPVPAGANCPDLRTVACPASVAKSESVPWKRRHPGRSGFEWNRANLAIWTLLTMPSTSTRSCWPTKDHSPLRRLGTC